MGSTCSSMAQCSASTCAFDEIPGRVATVVESTREDRRSLKAESPSWTD
jgi:hypothetical protein